MGYDPANVLINLGVIYSAGLLTAFTPCVYPLIPITLGIIGVRDSRSTLKSMGLSLSFVLGLAIVYSSLGFLAASTGRVFGSLTQKPWVVWPLASIFLLMGVSLLGAFELRLPSSLNSVLSRHGGRGVGGSFAMGAISGILAVPCAGPILVAILAFVAVRARPLYGFLQLFVYSLGIGTPLVLLGTLSHLLRRIPRGGAWTEVVRHGCGVALIAAFFLFIRPFLPSWSYFGLIALALVSLAVFVKRIIPAPDPGRHLVHSASRALLGGAAIFCLMIPSRPLVSGSNPRSFHRGLTWVSSREEALAQAQKLGKPVMLDFWAEWCTACKRMDAETFSDPKVIAALMGGFITAKIDTTSPSKNTETVLAEYGVSGLPQVLFLDASGKLLPEFSIRDFTPPERFIKHIESIRNQDTGDMKKAIGLGLDS